MIIFDHKVEEAIRDGLVDQVVLADQDGFVLDNKGYVYDPDELVAIFMSTQRQIQDGAVRFDFGQVSEFSFVLVGTDMKVACRRVFWHDGGCLVIVVGRADTAHNVIMRDAIRAYSKFVEGQIAALHRT
jgi:hypothetical protein